MKWLYKKVTDALIAYLRVPSEGRAKKTTNSAELLKQTIQPGDVLLVEGKERFSTGIKYLTQSNWSHAAIFVGPRGKNEKGEVLDLLEADIKEGVRLIPLSEYTSFHTRICRPLNLEKADLEKIIEFCYSKLGYRYDLENIFDLARYLFPVPWVPTKYKQKVLEFGSSDQTEVICSSLIAEAFHSIDYPILPIVEKGVEGTVHKRHPATLFTPSDFDRSPYFEIVKPTFKKGFNYHDFIWDKPYNKN